MKGQYRSKADIVSKFTPVSLFNYCARNIADYQTMTEIPQENLNYLNSGLGATSIGMMFSNCHKLKSIPNLDINTTDYLEDGNLSFIFSDCYDLESLDISWIDFSKVTSCYNAFSQSGSLTNTRFLDGKDFSNCTDFERMFQCDLYKYETGRSEISLKEIDLSGTTGIGNSEFDFHSFSYYNDDLEYVNLSTVNFANCIDIDAAFNFCSKLKRIDGVLDFSKITKISLNVFNSCDSLEYVALRNLGDFDPVRDLGLKQGQYEIVS